jgi:N-acylneuraminate cytidylyltransferase
MKRLAVIPARGGSKRIKRKNIRLLQGRPVIAYPLQTAMECGLFDEVIVSTDDPEIAQIAKAAGATIPFMRSEDTSGDHATIAQVLIEVLQKYGEKGVYFNEVCCILPTAALISTERIIEAHRVFSKGDLSSVVPVLRFSYPIQRALTARGGLLSFREPEHLNTRSQDLEPHFHDSAQFYWIRVADFIEEKHVFTSKTGFLEISETEAQDVDTEEDWRMLELKFQSRIKNAI